MPRVQTAVVTCAGILLLSCGSEPAAPLPDAWVPDHMRFVAVASGHVGGLDVECLIDYAVDGTREGHHWTGVWGGEVQRSVLDETGAGVGFFGIGHSELRIEFGDVGAPLVLRAFHDGAPLPPDGTSRFWDGILTITGTRTADPRSEIASGSWLCRPMDARGDTVATVPGTWTLEVR